VAFPNTFAIRGVSKEPFCHLIDKVKQGMPVTLVPEPENPYDPNAVKVMVGGANGEMLHIGYVPRELAEVVSKLLTEPGALWGAHICRLLPEDVGKGAVVMFFARDVMLQRQESKNTNVDGK